MAAEPLVFVFHDDTLYTFERAHGHTASIFGGPMPDRVSGQTFGPKPLHQIACLGGRHIPALNQYHLVELPLVYGMNYDNCSMAYRVHYGHSIELLSIQPASSSDDWPYANFPPLVPFVPLRLGDAGPRVSYDDFAARFPNMPARQRADLIVAVPPPATVGLSFWGMGDGDGVTILFECDLKDRKVSVSNVTS